MSIEARRNEMWRLCNGQTSIRWNHIPQQSHLPPLIAKDVPLSDLTGEVQNGVPPYECSIRILQLRMSAPIMPAMGIPSAPVISTSHT